MKEYVSYMQSYRFPREDIQRVVAQFYAATSRSEVLNICQKVHARVEGMDGERWRLPDDMKFLFKKLIDGSRYGERMDPRLVKKIRDELEKDHYLKSLTQLLVDLKDLVKPLKSLEGGQAIWHMGNTMLQCHNLKKVNKAEEALSPQSRAALQRALGPEAQGGLGCDEAMVGRMIQDLTHQSAEKAQKMSGNWITWAGSDRKLLREMQKDFLRLLYGSSGLETWVNAGSWRMKELEQMMIRRAVTSHWRGRDENERETWASMKRQITTLMENELEYKSAKKLGHLLTAVGLHFYGPAALHPARTSRKSQRDLLKRSGFISELEAMLASKDPGGFGFDPPMVNKMIANMYDQESLDKSEKLGMTWRTSERLGWKTRIRG